MFFSAATAPGTPGKPNEDWVGITPTVAVVLDGVTTFEGSRPVCTHGTPWYVDHLGTKVLAEATDTNVSLSASLANAIDAVAALHTGTCHVSDVGAPSAAVAVVRLGETRVEYLVLADVTVVLDSQDGLTVITDDRVDATVSDLEGRPGVGPVVMERRARYRNQEGGYWVAAADPEAAAHAITGDIELTKLRSAAALTDGVARIVAPFGKLDWGGLVSCGLGSGPAAVIKRVRSAEDEDPDCERWPRFKTSDDATIALLADLASLVKSKAEQAA
jgi:hypothetical protein